MSYNYELCLISLSHLIIFITYNLNHVSYLLMLSAVILTSVGSKYKYSISSLVLVSSITYGSLRCSDALPVKKISKLTN
jgi:hypothetical protein